MKTFLFEKYTRKHSNVKKGLKPFIFLMCFNFPLFAAATYTQGHSAAELAAKIQGPGLTITNPIIRRGDVQQTAIFSNGVAGANLDIDEGILLTTMDADNAFEENDETGKSTDNPNIASDPDLTAIDPLAENDTVVFEFDVTLGDNTHLLLINYQFASEEYNEYVGSQFNDAFGFFVSGGDLNQTYNIARVVDPQVFTNINNLSNFPPVTVNNVNNGTVGTFDDPLTPEDLTNSAYFIDNDDQGGNATVEVEFDGITVGLNATLDNLTPGETYHFKMALADTGDSAWDSGVFVNSIQGIRAPQICYDYAYKQNDRFFTEVYDASQGPHLTGDVIIGTPVEVSLYIKSTEDSDIPASNVKLNILDMNTSQITYTSQSVSVTDPGEVTPRAIADNTEGMTNTSSAINNIPVASLNSNQQFFAYYSVDPATTTLNTPINARIDYILHLELSPTQTLDLNQSGVIDEDTPLCLASAGAYNVQYGIFNIEHASIYPNQYYNLPTQVARRPDNFKIVSYADNDFNVRSDLNTSVFVELIDAGGFQDLNSSCNDPSSALTEKISVPMTNGVADFNEAVIIANSIDATKSAEDFFGNARESTAFRISYNLTYDKNESLIKTREEPEGSGNWYIDNFTEIAAGVVGANIDANLPVNEQNKCKDDVIVKEFLPNGNLKITTLTTMPQACGNASSTNAMSARELGMCMQCIFGFNTKNICARDNFATRPESLAIGIYDNAESTNSADPVLNVPNESHIAAGYNYRYDVNATSHVSNTPVPGYTRYYTGTSLADHNLTYNWKPLTTLTGCNDTLDKYPVINLINGQALNNQNKNDNVGRYELEMRDIGWTKADQSPPHHTGGFFLPGNDCLITSSSTPELADQLTRSNVGCITSSNNINADDSTLNTEDYNITVRAYDFNLSTVTFNKGVSSVGVQANDYVYLNNVLVDSNMSVRYSGDIRVVGKNGGQLSNFVANCYAKDINLELNTSALPATPLFNYRLIETNASNGLDFNETDGNNGGDPILPAVAIPAENFLKSSLGASTMALNVNFDRNVTDAINPITLNYNSFNVSCINTADCRSNAEMSTNHLPDSNVTSLSSVIHIYGRVHTPRQRVANPNPANAITAAIPLYYEFYCNSATGCNITDYNNAALVPLSPIGLLSQDDVRWYSQNEHNVSNDGNATETQPRSAIDENFITQHDINDDANGSVYNYTGNEGYPYKTTIELNASNWLIYNRFDAAADVNDFELEFFSTGTFAGQDESNVSMDANTSINVNRRISW